MHVTCLYHVKFVVKEEGTLMRDRVVFHRLHSTLPGISSSRHREQVAGTGRGACSGEQGAGGRAGEGAGRRGGGLTCARLRSRRSWNHTCAEAGIISSKPRYSTSALPLPAAGFSSATHSNAEPSAVTHETLH